MTRRSRIAVVVVALAVLAVAAWWGVARLDATTASRSRGDTDAGAGVPGAPATGADPRAAARPASLPFGVRVETEVAIAGRVVDVKHHRGVGPVEVVFRGPRGETSTTSGADGAYTIRVAPGTYRAFVRDERALSVGVPDAVRLPAPPSPETAGVPDEALMAIVVASGDTDGVDLTVARAGDVIGRVIDRDGRGIAGAMVRALGELRPAMGTDIAESDATGRFELRLPAGDFILEATHPRFAGIDPGERAQITVRTGAQARAELSLVAGCVIAGRVVGPDGKPAGDGAIEKQWVPNALRYAPAGRIEPDGTFRWTTVEDGDVVLRAWPWQSPPSQGRRFDCRDGARHEDVVFALPDDGPDIEGRLVDRSGEPVGFAFVDLAPLDAGGLAQQERSDANGYWSVYNMPPGRYRVTAHAEGRGIANATIVSPRDRVRLELGGTGRLRGTTSRLATGSFELVLGACFDGTRPIAVPQSRRIVAVSAGQFTVDDLPACELSIGVIWRGEATTHRVAIPSGGIAQLELDLGPPRAKIVHGVVRDAAGQPFAGAVVTATYQGRNATVRSDAAGAYTLETFSAARVRASAPGLVGFGRVGAAHLDRERVDLALEGASDIESDE